MQAKGRSSGPYNIDDCVQVLANMGVASSVDPGALDYIDNAVHEHLDKQGHNDPSPQLWASSSSSTPASSVLAPPVGTSAAPALFEEPIAAIHEFAPHAEAGPMVAALIRRLQRQVWYWKDRCQRLQAKVRAGDRQRLATVADARLTKANPKRRRTSKEYRLSTLGKYRVALKRNYGHASQEATCAMLEAQVGRQTLSKCESLLSANLLATTLIWYKRWNSAVETKHAGCAAGCDAADSDEAPLDRLRRHRAKSESPRLTFEIHSFRGDVTPPIPVAKLACLCLLTGAAAKAEGKGRSKRT